MLGQDNFIKRELLTHRKAYLLLLVELVIFVGLFIAAWPNRFFQRILILFMVFFYLSWGIIAHVKTNHVSKQVILEYVGVGLLGGALLLMVTF